jgi:hypothetical protein
LSLQAGSRKLIASGTWDIFIAGEEVDWAWLAFGAAT